MYWGLWIIRQKFADPWEIQIAQGAVICITLVVGFNNQSLEVLLLDNEDGYERLGSDYKLSPPKQI